MKTLRLFKILVSIIISIYLLTGCELYEQDSYQELIQLESYLIANRSLPQVRLSRTLPIDQEYTFNDAAVTGADIRITLLDQNDSPREVFIYTQSQSEGVYLPINNTHQVLPGRTYRIDVEFLNRPEVLQSETTIPDQVEVINDVRETVVYQSEEQLEIVLAPTTQTQAQNVFLFDAIAVNPSFENLTPFYLAAVEDGDSDIEDFFSNSSGLINEGNFDIMPDGTISLKFPWIGAAFYGETIVVTNSVDRNLTDLLRSQEVQLGGSTLSPGEIPNLRYNVEGGIGIFGSISSDSVLTNFLRP